MNVPAFEELARCDCGSPMELIIGDSVVVTRCTVGRHVEAVQSVYPEAWFPE